MINSLKKAASCFNRLLFHNKSSRQTIAKNSFWLLLAEGSNKGILFLVAVLIARHFSVEEYGVFGFVFSIMTLIAMIADFGLANITIREMAKKHDESATCFDNTISLKLLLTGIAFLTMIAASVFLSPEVRILALLAGIAILVEGMTDFLRTSFRVSEHAQYEVVIKAATALVLICLVIGAILLKLSLEHIILGYIVAHVLGLLLAIRLLDRRIAISINCAVVRPLLIESWPMFLGLICTSAYGQIDLILIKAFRGFAEVGLYLAAYKIMFGFQLLRVVHMAMFPRLAVLYAEGDFKGYRRLMRRSILWSIVFLTPIGIFSAIFPKDIILMFFGQGYVGAAIALPFLLWSGIISFVASFFSNTLMIAGRQRIWFIMEFMVLAILIIIEFLLIPTIGFMGAAIATFAGELCFLGLILAWVATNSKLRALFFSGDQKKC